MPLPTMNIPDFVGASHTVNLANSGRQAAADSGAAVLCTEDKASLDAIGTKLDTLNTAVASNGISSVEVGPFTSKEIAASQTNAVLGATGAVGDYLSHLIIQPATTSPGVVTLFDGSTGGTNVTVYSFPGGASSLTNLAPLIIPLPANCVNAGWHITTGANVAVTAVGRFT